MSFFVRASLTFIRAAVIVLTLAVAGTAAPLASAAASSQATTTAVKQKKKKKKAKVRSRRQAKMVKGKKVPKAKWQHATAKARRQGARHKPALAPASTKPIAAVAPPPAARAAAPAPSTKPVAAAATPALPVATTPAALPGESVKKPKGLSAKALADVQEDKADDDSTAGIDRGEDEDGNSIWQVLVVFLLFSGASAATFVYLKRKGAKAGIIADPAFTSTQSPSGLAQAIGHMDMTHPPKAAASADAVATPAPKAPEPSTFEQFVEMQVAQTCWAEQGLDLVSHLRTYFNATMLEWSKISVYWKPRYLADEQLMKRFKQLEAEYRGKYGQAA